MNSFDTVIFNHEGRFFKFKKAADSYICNICYWKGEIQKTGSGWSAEVQQKFNPFEHEAINQLSSQDEAMRWIAAKLVKK